MINKVTHPIHFQGNLQKKNYFEGWYYKQVSADEKTVISFIPGIVLAEGDSHSFIQYTYVHIAANGQKEMRTGYLRYAIEDFVYNSKPFLIKIGDNIFSETLVSVHLEDGPFRVDGLLNIGALPGNQADGSDALDHGLFCLYPENGMLPWRHQHEPFR